MKRLLAVLGAFALLGTLFVLAGSSPAGAAPDDIVVNIDNDLEISVLVTSSGCGYTEGPSTTLTPGQQDFELRLAGDCLNWTVTGVDVDGRCTIEGNFNSRPIDSDVNAEDGTDPLDPPGNVKSGIGPDYTWWINYTEAVCATPIELTFEKETGDDGAPGLLTTWTFTLESSGDQCAAGGTYELTGDELPPPAPEDSDEVNLEVPIGYVVDNAFVWCEYTITEAPVAGWTLVGFEDLTPPHCWDTSTADMSATLDGACLFINYSSAEVGFVNELDPLPLTVTKTFTGRDYYTTVDRADFHLFTPGLCGKLPFDPFGGLLGSVGVFRTINASQLPQVVLALPDVPAARYLNPFAEEDESGAGACTYRVQENNAPEGCVALNPDGSDADGPYWEQTWVPGVTTQFVFNIVNDCAEVPEPTPEPSVAPTNAPKKPGAKKPSGGGTAAPKFTG